MKKRFMTVLAAGLCICLMAACGGNSGKKETEAPIEVVTETEAVTETETEAPTETETEAVTETETETELVTETETETEAPETEPPAETEAPLGEGEKLFVSDEMRFSFHYDEAHTARITDVGAAELAINGDDSLVGLFVSVVRADGLPNVEQLIEEEMFNETQKYQNAIVQQPAKNDILMDGHTLNGYIFCYSDENGKTVDCTYYVEKREGRGIFYRTAVYRDAEDYWAGQDALEKAVRTLEFKN